MTEDDMVESVPRRVRKTDLKLQVEEELVRFIKAAKGGRTGPDVRRQPYYPAQCAG